VSRAGAGVACVVMPSFSLPHPLPPSLPPSLPPHLIAHIAGRGADEAGDGEFLRELGHIQAGHGALVPEEEVAEFLRQMRLSHPRGPQEQEDSHWPVVGPKPRPGEPGGGREGGREGGEEARTKSGPDTYFFPTLPPTLPPALPPALTGHNSPPP
jgi:hypothetical protein